MTQSEHQPMPASRLSDGQKTEMVERFRQGVSTLDLADAYGCSPNTISRLVKAAMDITEYERLKRQRQRRLGASEPMGSAPHQPALDQKPLAPEGPAVADGPDCSSLAEQPAVSEQQIGRAHV